MSGFQKVLAQGAAGSVVLSEEGLDLSLQVTSVVSIGGGSTAGVIKNELSNKSTIEGGMLIDAGLDYAAHKFPSVAIAVEGLKALIDAEKAKV